MKWRKFTALQENWGRLFGLFTFAFFLIRQLLPQSMYGMYPGLDDGLIFLRWCLVTFLFILFFHAYLKRTPALSLANRPVEVLLPLICAPLPIIMIVLCQLYYQQELFRNFIFDMDLNGLFSPWVVTSETKVKLGLMVMALGEIITISGMWYLRSSFSIFSEARALVSRGLYQYIRHPLYLGEIVSVWGYAFLLPNTVTIVCSAVFTVLQVIRAKVEETKLSSVHPQYIQYQQSTGFLLPKLLKRSS